MKVTILLSLYTLVVLLQQMQSPMAKPQPRQVDQPPLLEDFSEWIFALPQHLVR